MGCSSFVSKSCIFCHIVDAGAADARQFGRECTWVLAPIGRRTHMGKAALNNIDMREAWRFVVIFRESTLFYRNGLTIGRMDTLVSVDEIARKRGTGLICRNGPVGASHKLAPSPFSLRNIFNTTLDCIYAPKPGFGNTQLTS
jgi:hypothetical protein